MLPVLLLQSNWSEWWFPGLDRFAEMVAVVFWWGAAIVVAAILLAIISLIIFVIVLLVGLIFGW